AILAAGYFHGLSLDAVATLALDIIDKILSLTLELERDIKWGLCYEPYLGYLASRLMVLKEEKE
ncbi:MAG: pyridoxamine kinase, partial [Lactobacillales bacterium]|nr:pyridoxamine kinase [Lactobacillales bacterium]